MLAALSLGSIYTLGQDSKARPQADPAKGQRLVGLARRTPWTSSRITGSPEPPHPYRIARAFPKLTFKNPLLLSNAPGTDRLFIGEQYGKLYSFRNDQAVEKADLFLDLTKELHSWDKNGKVKGVGALYGLTFHPQFARNRYCYVCYVLDSKTDGEQLPDGSRVSRFRVTDTDPPRIDPRSEKILITFMAGGHNGGCLCFGPDGYLYISTGDAANPNPPDVLDTGQDLSDLLSSILRIDVDHEEKGKAYAVPPDNPFVKTPGARPEIWAYGFRNPWKMSFDRGTGDLWVGDVGWELWEMIYHVRRGGNYGWSVMEGRQPVRPDSKRGPTPILPPALDFPHTEAASITGGFVYRGRRYKELIGTYICGDWVTRKIWGTRFDANDQITWHKELAQGTQRIVAFSEDNGGELYFVNYDDPGGTLHQLVPNEAAKKSQAAFPRKLSETGLFAAVPNALAPGVVAFPVNVEQWMDHAYAHRYIALPGTSTVRVYDHPVPTPGGFYNGQYFFPPDGVLARTISLEMERGKPASWRRLETQILHFDGTTWHGYTYEWNDDQTDALLVPAAGRDRTFTIRDAQAPGGKRRQTWHFPSRTECLTCHNPWAGGVLAFTLPQLSVLMDNGGVSADQIEILQQKGIITPSREAGQAPVDPKELTRSYQFVDPYNDHWDLNSRARSYLHVNCSHCHQFGAGGTADIELRYDVPLPQTKTLGVRPVQGTFDIEGANILAPGDPYRSVLYYRMAKLGQGRMPHIGSEIVDEKGVRLIHDWIRQLPIRPDQNALVEKLRTLDEPSFLAAERKAESKRLQESAMAIAKSRGREFVTAQDREQAQVQLREQAANQAKARAAERADAISRLLSTTSGALLLAHALGDGLIPPSVRPEVLAAAQKRDSQIRDLFERFLPDDQRVQRLGNQVKPETILSLKGDPARGKELYFKTAGLQCINCHQISGTGSKLGPDLSHIGKKYNRAQILENILDPSKSMDPPYIPYLAETADGRVYTGLLVSRTEKEVVLKDAKDQEIRLPAKKVESLVAQKKSLMPEQLLRDLTAQQAADLVDYLYSLK
jgi:putative heme-binding domain-containing protein